MLLAASICTVRINDRVPTGNAAARSIAEPSTPRPVKTGHPVADYPEGRRRGRSPTGAKRMRLRRGRTLVRSYVSLRIGSDSGPEGGPAVDQLGPGCYHSGNVCGHLLRAVELLLGQSARNRLGGLRSSLQCDRRLADSELLCWSRAVDRPRLSVDSGRSGIRDQRVRSNGGGGRSRDSGCRRSGMTGRVRDCNISGSRTLVHDHSQRRRGNRHSGEKDGISGRAAVVIGWDGGHRSRVRLVAASPRWHSTDRPFMADHGALDGQLPRNRPLSQPNVMTMLRSVVTG